MRRPGSTGDSAAAVQTDDPTAALGSMGVSQLGQRTPKMARLEAVLMVASGALNARRLAQFATLADPTESRTLVRKLNELYDSGGTAFRIEQVASGYQLLTRAEYAFWLSKLHERQAELKLSPPALETLAIIAYRQPIIRADVEAIRGVGCIEILKQLMDRESRQDRRGGRVPRAAASLRSYASLPGNLRPAQHRRLADVRPFAPRRYARADDSQLPKAPAAAPVQPPHFDVAAALPVRETPTA